MQIAACTDHVAHFRFIIIINQPSKNYFSDDREFLSAVSLHVVTAALTSLYAVWDPF
jgi:hypothetical protein